MAEIALNGTVDDFDRYYVYDRATVPTIQRSKEIP